MRTHFDTGVIDNLLESLEPRSVSPPAGNHAARLSPNPPDPTRAPIARTPSPGGEAKPVASILDTAVIDDLLESLGPELAHCSLFPSPRRAG